MAAVESIRMFDGGAGLAVLCPWGEAAASSSGTTGKLCSAESREWNGNMKGRRIFALRGRGEVRTMAAASEGGCLWPGFKGPKSRKIVSCQAMSGQRTMGTLNVHTHKLPLIAEKLDLSDVL